MIVPKFVGTVILQLAGISIWLLHFGSDGYFDVLILCIQFYEYRVMQTDNNPPHLALYINHLRCGNKLYSIQPDFCFYQAPRVRVENPEVFHLCTATKGPVVEMIGVMFELPLLVHLIVYAVEKR